MFKKMTVLAIAAGVVAALALPASASAVGWSHHQQGAIQNNVQIGLTGNVRFQGGLGGVECQVTSAVTFEPGTTGVIQSFDPHPTDATTNCRGLGGLAFCQIHNVVPTEFPWVIHTVQSPPAIEITHGEIHSQPTGAFCPVKSVTITKSSATDLVTAHPNQPNTVTSVQVTGQTHVLLQTNSGAVDTEQATVSSNDVIIESPNAHTYNI